MSYRLRQVIRGVFIAMLMAGVLFAGGCQQEVVRTHNNWIGSQLERIETPRLSAPQQPGAGGGVGAVLRNTGDLLLGWTRHLTGQPQAQPPHYVNIDVQSRQHSPGASITGAPGTSAASPPPSSPPAPK